MRRLKWFGSALVCLAVAATPTAARADVTSWFAIGTGYAYNHYSSAQRYDGAGVLTYSLGVGTSSLNPFVIGGILRGTSFFSQGTDLSLAIRAATGGFARGDWGLALDAGVVGRWWGGDAYGDYPLQFILTGGMPWGLGVAVGADVWSVSGQEPARGLFGVLEIDFLRLTVMRQGSTDAFWKNPSPAGGRLQKE